MKIRMKTLAASPSGIMHPDETYDVADDLGERLVSAGCAEQIELEKPVPEPRGGSTEDAGDRKDAADSSGEDSGGC